MMDPKEIKRSAAEWQYLYPDVIVHDPDGWDRKNLTKSWLTPITLEEYEFRVALSTCHYIGRDNHFLRTGRFEDAAE